MAFWADDCRHILSYFVSAAMTLLAGILDVSGREMRPDIELVGSLARFVEVWMAEQGCDLAKVLAGCKEMERLAIATVEEAVTVQPSATGSGWLQGHAAGNTAHVSCRSIKLDDQ